MTTKSRTARLRRDAAFAALRAELQFTVPAHMLDEVVDGALDALEAARAEERRREPLIDVGVEWLDAVDDNVAAAQSEDDLAEQVSAFVDGSGWHEEAAR